MYGQSETEEVLGPESEYDDLRRVTKNFNTLSFLVMIVLINIAHTYNFESFLCSKHFIWLSPMCCVD
jgi:hypothetical protein